MSITNLEKETGSIECMNSRPLFDIHGRLIPTVPDVAVIDPDMSIYTKIPAFEAGRGWDVLKVFINLPGAELSLEEFQDAVEILKTEIKSNPQIANLMKGLCLPIFVPKSSVNIGKYIDLVLFETKCVPSRLVPYINMADYRFSLHEMNNRVEIIKNTRYVGYYEELSCNYKIALLFPRATLGFSLDAQRKHEPCLPNGCLFAGAAEFSLAFRMYQEILVDRQHPILYTCPTLNLLPDKDIFFKVKMNELFFGASNPVLQIHANATGGILYTGSR